MSTLLQETAIPLWVWIVIIVVGSIVLLGTIAFVLRFTVVRRRQAAFVDTFGDENLPQRRVTVRRGRVVEQSKYLSLTGSKFGLNAFGPEDGDANSRAGARSKSPFEWWSMVRSQSRNSGMTQTTFTGDGRSSIYGPASPNAQRIYRRSDLNYSTTSLGSVNKEDVDVSVTESEPSPPPAVKNFSRSFSRQGHFPPRMQTLSRIEESSPHTSMISTRQSRGVSVASNKRDTKTSTPSPTWPSPTLASQPFSHLPERDHRTSRAKSIQQQIPEEGTFIQQPLPVAYNGSRSSLGDTIIHTSSKRHSFAESTKSRRQSQITALPEPPVPQQTDEYWHCRADLQPIRSPSMGKKGNVLRKKSLKKAKISSQIDS